MQATGYVVRFREWAGEMPQGRDAATKRRQLERSSSPDNIPSKRLRQEYETRMKKRADPFPAHRKAPTEKKKPVVQVSSLVPEEDSDDEEDSESLRSQDWR